MTTVSLFEAKTHLSALMLVAARLRHIAGTKWGSKRYLSMERLYELERMKEAI